MSHAPDAHREYEALVRQLEADAAANPAEYRFRVTLYAVLGYAYLIGTVVASLLLVGVVAYVMLALHAEAAAGKTVGPLLFVVFLLLRSLWVRIPDPVGVRVTKERVPQLFALLEEVREQVNGPPLHHVLLSSDFNAAIVQARRLGVLGAPRNFLIVGMPLLCLLPAPEVRAVIAHEMGHLVGTHGRFSAWVYRQRLTWSRLQAHMEARSIVASPIYTAFLKWYAPLFDAYTLVMARMHEHHADALAARVTGSRVQADALVRVALTDGWLSHVFWPGMVRRARSMPLPPGTLLEDMTSSANEAFKVLKADAALAHVLARKTSSMDTHPSLSDRLRALGEPALPPALGGEGAAKDVLGPEFEALVTLINRQMYDAMLPGWKDANARAQEQRKRLAELCRKDLDGPLTPGEQFDRACILRDEGDQMAAERIIEELAMAHPTLAVVQSAYGSILLGRGDEHGLTVIDRALALGGVDPTEACTPARDFLLSQGREAEAGRYAECLRAHQEKVAAAHAERATFGLKDAIEPHALPEKALDAVRQLLAERPEIRSAIMVRKRVAHFPESGMHVMAIRLRPNWRYWLLPELRREEGIAARDHLLSRLEIGDRWMCVALDLAPVWQRRKFEATAGPPFYLAP